MILIKKLNLFYWSKRYGNLYNLKDKDWITTNIPIGFTTNNISVNLKNTTFTKIIKIKD